MGLSMTALQDDATRGEDVELEPGYAWSNKKAREEYDRAMEHVVDKTFSLRKSPPHFFWCTSEVAF